MKCTSIGEGIFSYSPTGEVDADDLILKGYIRFMDFLFLPVQLGSLTVEQICVINRYRDQNIYTLPQFKHRFVIRKSVINTLNIWRKDCSQFRVLEIGCGRYPLCKELDVDRYHAIEIDEKLIFELNGISIGSELDLTYMNNIYDADICISLYAFHFNISDRLLRFSEQALSNEGIVVYNLVGSDVNDYLSVAERMSERGFYYRILKHRALSRKEHFFLGGKIESLEKLDVFYRILESQLNYVSSIQS